MADDVGLSSGQPPREPNELGTRFYRSWKLDVQARAVQLCAELKRLPQQIQPQEPATQPAEQQEIASEQPEPHDPVNLPATGRPAQDDVSAIVAAAEAEIEEARLLMRRARFFTGSTVDSAYMHVHSAEVYLTHLLSLQALEARAPYLASKAKGLLPPHSKRRRAIEALVPPAYTSALDPESAARCTRTGSPCVAQPANSEEGLGTDNVSDSMASAQRTARTSVVPIPDGYRMRFVEAVHNLHQIADQQYAQLRRFRNNLRLVGILISIMIVVLVTIGYRTPSAIPLCFYPRGATENDDIVQACPTSETTLESTASVPPSVPTGAAADSGPNDDDVLIVALLGIVGAALSGALAAKNFRPPPRTPYNLPLYAFLFKLPVGALTAIGGLILLTGEVVPGLSALDSQGQVLAYALLFGFAQHLFTKYLDAHAMEILLGIPEKSKDAPDATAGEASSAK